MIHEMVLRATQAHFTTNEDGTHTVKIEAQGQNLEFLCTLRPHLTIKIEVDDRQNRIVLANGEHVASRTQAELHLEIDWDIISAPDGHIWVLRVLDVDDCGNPRGAQDGLPA